MSVIPKRAAGRDPECERRVDARCGDNRAAYRQIRVHENRGEARNKRCEQRAAQRRPAREEHERESRQCERGAVVDREGGNRCNQRCGTHQMRCRCGSSAPRTPQPMRPRKSRPGARRHRSHVSMGSQPAQTQAPRQNRSPLRRERDQQRGQRRRRAGRRNRRKHVEPPSNATNGEHVAPQPTHENVARKPRRVRDAQDVGHGLKVGRIPERDIAAERCEVHAQRHRKRDENCSRRTQARTQERQTTLDDGS